MKKSRVLLFSAVLAVSAIALSACSQVNLSGTGNQAFPQGGPEMGTPPENSERPEGIPAEGELPSGGPSDNQDFGGNQAPLE